MAPPEFMTKDDAEYLIESTVHKTLTSMGVDTSKPMEMQRDFQALREWRVTLATMRSRGIMVVVGLIVTGVVTAVGLGFKYVTKQ